MKNRFNEIAHTWDNPRKARMAETFVNALMNKIEILPEWNCFEIGAGTGLAGMLLLPRVKLLVFEDTSENMLKVLKEKTANHTNADTFLGKVTDYKGGVFDLVISNMAFHHIAEIDKTLQHLAEITAENATVAIADLVEEDGSFHNGMEVPHRGFNIEMLSSQFDNAGFEVLHTEVFDVIRKVDENGSEKIYERFILIGKKKRTR